MLTLYTTLLSANGRKVVAVCEQLGLRPEVVEVNVYAGAGRAREYLAVNPFGKIPTLVEGDLTLWESNAILQYLAEAHGAGRLWGRDAKRRADVARWLFWESAHWQPAIAAVPGLAPRVAGLLGIPGGDASAEVTWTAPAFVALAKFLDGTLRERPWLAGDELTIADFSVAGMMTYARAASFPFDDFGGIAPWYARVEALGAWRKTAVAPWTY